MPSVYVQLHPINPNESPVKLAHEAITVARLLDIPVSLDGQHIYCPSTSCSPRCPTCFPLSPIPAITPPDPHWEAP